VVEKSHPEKIDQPQKPSPPPPPPQPNELRWWELQLGFALPKGLYTDTTTGR
jgi:hypothetical protein